MEYSAIKMNTFESVLVRCITLEPAIQSEVNQKETYYYTHTHTHMEIYKNGADMPICRTGTLRKTQTCGHSRGRRGWDRPRSTETYDCV